MKKIISLILCIIMLISTCIYTYALSFSDVGDEYAWAAEAIEKFSEKKIIEGRGDGKFVPEDDVTRAEFAKMLALTFGLQSDASVAYVDIEEGSWEHKYISMVHTHTISANVLDSAVDKNMYMPNKSASRQEIAAAIVNVLGIKIDGADYLKDNFADYKSVNKQIYNSVNAAVQTQLILGYEDKTLRPEDNVTRAEAVVLLNRAYEYKMLHDEPVVTPSPAEPTPVPAVDIISVVDTAQTIVGNERYYLLYYSFKGAVFKEPLLVRENAEIGGLETNFSNISCGDVILYSLHSKGYVNAIRVIYSPGESANYAGKALNEVVSPPTKMNWGLYNQGNSVELLFGKVSKVKNTDNGFVLILDYNGDKNQAVLLPKEGLSVSLYKPHKNALEKRFSVISTSDIQVQPLDMEQNYVLVKIKRDVVTDVIVIDYNR